MDNIKLKQAIFKPNIKHLQYSNLNIAKEYSFYTPNS
jgi:hypothetical protein